MKHIERKVRQRQSRRQAEQEIKRKMTQESTSQRYKMSQSRKKAARGISQVQSKPKKKRGWLKSGISLMKWAYQLSINKKTRKQRKRWK